MRHRTNCRRCRVILQTGRRRADGALSAVHMATLTDVSFTAGEVAVSGNSAGQQHQQLVDDDDDKRVERACSSAGQGRAFQVVQL